MNKKILTSIFAVAAIAVTSANAAVTKAQCEKSDKTIWVENVHNSDGSNGACVPKDACNTSAFRDYCNTIFEDVQLPNVGDAELMIFRYLKHQKLVQTMGDIRFYHVSIDNSVGQDYVGASYKGTYTEFEFDDTNETFLSTSEEGMAKAFCLANGGRFEGKYSVGLMDSVNNPYVCTSMSESTCKDMLGFMDAGTVYENERCLYFLKMN